MTNELIALVAILSNDALPDSPGDGDIELNYIDQPQYMRAVDVLDRLGLLTDDQVAVRTLSSGSQFERIKVGGLTILSPVNFLHATDRFVAAEETAPISRLASVTPVEGQTGLQPIMTKVRHLTPLPAFYSGDPGDEHHGPEAA